MSLGVLTDRSGGTIALGAELARGGEGAVFDVRGRPDVVAKLYHEVPNAARAAKLEALVDVCSKELSSSTAWPQDLLYGPHRRIVGFLMPRLSGRHDLHVLYGPRTRLRSFPDAGWRFLIRAAANLAHAFTAVHRAGHVVGDVNDRVALVSSDALIHLVDCDSFQVRHGGRLHTCDVGIPLYQPPELQTVSSFRGLERTPEHDRFGLAVLIFQLLFLARHPFSGMYLGPGDMQIEQAIQSCLFAYSRDARAKKMKPPPASLSLSVLSGELASLFERAFAPDAPKRGRPSADEWATALGSFEQLLQPCPRNPNHALRLGLSECPICEIERRVGIALFGFPAPSARPFAIDVRALWTAIQSVPRVDTWSSDPSAAILAQPVAISNLGHEVRRARKRARKIRAALLLLAIGSVIASSELHVAFGVAGLVILLLGWRRSRIDNCDAWQASSAAFDEADTQLAELYRRWPQETSAEPFDRCLRELEATRSAVDQLVVERARRIAVLERDRRAEQLEDFLDRHRLARAEIPGIGATRKTMLESYGIETAADIDAQKIGAVPGFGPGLTNKLLAWRRDVEARFVFDPSRPIDARKLDQLDRELELRRRSSIRILTEGPEKLRRLRSDIEGRRTAMLEALRVAAAQRDQARCDLGIIQPG